MLSITRTNHGSDRTKGFLTKDRHLRRDVGQNRWRVEVAFALQWFAAQSHLCAHLDRGLHLFIQILTQIAARHRPDLRLALHWIAHAKLGGNLNKFLFKGVGNRLHHDKALSSNTTLPCVLEASTRCRLCSGIEVGIVQDDKSIRATKFQYRSLQGTSTR